MGLSLKPWRLPVPNVWSLQEIGGRWELVFDRVTRRGDPVADVCLSYLLMKLHAAEIATTDLDTYCKLVVKT
jgi:hypothetical protein